MTFWMYSNWAFYISPAGQEFKKIVGQIQEFTKKVSQFVIILFLEIENNFECILNSKNSLK